MHCYICDRVDDQIQFNKITQEYEPCTTCLAVIADCLSDFDEHEWDSNETEDGN